MNESIVFNHERQLFIDNFCIESLNNTRRRFHSARKHPANPLITPQEPWEADYIQLYGNVLFDTDINKFRMWYSARYTPEGEKKCLNTICHASSTDGLHWERTPVNRLEHNGLSLGNAVMKGQAIGPTVFHTPGDPNPDRRYRMFVYTGDEILDASRMKAAFSQHYSIFFSPDGYTWTPYENNPVVQGGDIATCLYDPVTQEYIAFPKIHRSDDGFNRRCVGVSLSRDFATWLTPNIILSADAIDDARVADRLERFQDRLVYVNPEQYHADMYGMTAYRCGGLRIGLIWHFDISAHRPRELGGNHDGPVNIQLAYSRNPDAYSGWKRTEGRRDFLACGDDGAYDSGSIYTAHSVIEREDELWIYYTGIDRTHGDRGSADKYSRFSREPHQPHSLNVATLRKEGFASIEAHYPPGSMTTRPLTLEGERLIINADAEKGAIHVEVTDPEGHPLPGFTRDDCLPFQDDCTSGEVRWKNATLATLRGQTVRLTFHLQTARLYAMSCPSRD